MLGQYPLVILPLLASALVTASLAVHSWRQRTVPGARPFAFTMLMVTAWSLANALETSAPDLNSKLFWANTQYLSYVAIPIGWLTMTLEYTHRARWMGRRLVLLSIIPTLTVVLVWTNHLHGLMRYDVYLDTDGPFSVVGKSYGPWFWVHSAYSYLLLSACVLLLLDRLLHTPAIFRRQLLTLLVGMLVPMAGSASYWLKLSPIQQFDPTPILLGLAGILVAWALFRYHLFNVVPVAYGRVVEGIRDGVIVLSTEGQLAGLNPAAQKIFAWPPSEVLGKQATELFGQHPRLKEVARSATDGPIDLELGTDSSPRRYEVSGAPLTDPRWGLMGRVIVVRDTTERTQAQELLLRQQRTLAVLEERERLAREVHDSLGQVLGYVNTQAQAVRELLVRGQTATADAYLARLVAVAQDAHADVREYILDLKAAADSQEGFFSSLEQHVRRYSRNHGIKTELIIPHDLEADALDPAVQLQLLRIIQEALANVRKHAQATRVKILFAVQDGRLQVEIQDNGRGFAPDLRDGRDGGSFGLRIMEERAQGVSGSLLLQSAQGQGTKVIVQVPLTQEVRSTKDEVTASR